MRCTQFYGLTDEAEKFLEEFCIKEAASHCPHCNGPIGNKLKSEVYRDEKEVGMFDDGPSLRQYFLKDGRIFREIIQHTVWSSGPCVYLCLQDENGSDLFKWPQNDMET